MAYDQLFYDLALRNGLIAGNVAASKTSVRDALRRQADGENTWQALQAQVYGDCVAEAAPFPGALAFVAHAAECGVHVSIVSHKTPYAAARPGGSNLQLAARNWLAAHGFLGAGLVAVADVFFESSRASKIARLRERAPAIVIDDLIEVLTDPQFPVGARRWHFDPGCAKRYDGPIERFGNWDAMRDALDLVCDAT